MAAVASGLGQGDAPNHNANEDGLVEDAPAQQAGGLIGIPPAEARNSRGTVPRSDFAGAYRSIFTLTPPGDRFLRIVPHVNCNYLSTKGHAPTLLELKQHTQSLVILIKQIALSTSPGVVDNASSGAASIPRFNANEAFDFLNDLGIPYTNNTIHHNLPLVSLLNTIEPGLGGQQDIDICPLHHVEPAPLSGPSLPYATHEALIKHANEALELIDHEYSAKGGLLGILPHADEKGDRLLAESTLLGQFILYMQRLVARLHHLERMHANAMDVIGGEATVPHQALSRLGPDGRSGRELVYPQDRFVLVNAGEDVWQFLNDEFERKERIDEQVRNSYLRMGIEGEKLWERKGGREFARGLTVIDVTTRYYRLREDALKTIFIIPAHMEHPGTKATREMEKQPTVVSVVKPVWPERVSVWEKKVRDDLEELKRLRIENRQLQEMTETMQNERAFLEHDVAVKSALARKASIDAERYKSIMESGGNSLDNLKLEFLKEKADFDKSKAELEAEKEAITKAKQDFTVQETALVTRNRSITAALNSERASLQQRRKELEKVHKQTMENFEIERQVVKQEALETADKFQKAWIDQIEQTQVVVEFLSSEEVRRVLAREHIPESFQKLGTTNAQKIIQEVLKGLGKGES